MIKGKCFKVTLAAIVILGLLTIPRLNFYRSTQKEMASKKGFEWLINQQDKMKPNSAVINYKKFYKATSDEVTADKLSVIIKKIQGSQTPSPPVVISEKDAKFKDWMNIEPVAADLHNEQCSGPDISAEVSKLQKIYLSDKEAIGTEVANSRDLTSVLTLLYSLGTVGIYDNGLLNQATAKTIELMSRGNYSVNDIYALTHIIFTNSGYYDRYLNSADFPEETVLLKGILSKYSSAEKLSGQEMDMLFEVIINLKLLGQAEGKDVETVSQKLIKMQNEDGSWGAPDESYEIKIHHTVVATLALMDFTKNFREADVFCWSK